MISPSEAIRALTGTGRSARRIGAAVLAMVLLAAAGAPLAAQQEAETAQERPDRHEVDEGDTLWDLADRYLTDPFSWPRIFEVNQDVVEDPHWIYPGEVLQLPGAETAADVTGVQVAERDGARSDTLAPAPEPQRGGRDDFSGPSIFDRNPGQGVVTGGFSIERADRSSLVSRSVFFSAGFLADYEAVRPRGTVVRVLEENPLGLEIPPSARLGDRVIVGLNGLDVSEGDTLQAVREQREVGRGMSVVDSRGLLEVGDLRGDSARATVVAVYGPLQAGDHVIETQPYTVGDLRRLRSTDDGLRATIRALAVEQPLVATGDLVFLNVGSSAGVSVGDEFAVFTRDVRDPAAAPGEDQLGVVRVVRVREGTATARVTDVRDLGIRVGAPALRVRQPVQPGT